MRTRSSPAHCGLPDQAVRREVVSGGRGGRRADGRGDGGCEVSRADRPSLQTEHKTARRGKVCVRHFCNSWRLGPALAQTVNESKPGRALPVSRPPLAPLPQAPPLWPPQAKLEAAPSPGGWFFEEECVAGQGQTRAEREAFSVACPAPAAAGARMNESWPPKGYVHVLAQGTCACGLI